MVAMVRAGVELAYETMVEAGIVEESAYYVSLHETPLIANLVARKKLYEMNVVISDTAEYGCYLFDHLARPLLAEKFMTSIKTDVIGAGLADNNASVDNKTLVDINAQLRGHSVEIVGQKLRGYMTGMKAIV
jgi:ketol-acid reductoisomerase